MHSWESERQPCSWGGFYRPADASIVHLENLLVRVKLLLNERVVDADLRSETELRTTGLGGVCQKIPSSRANRSSGQGPCPCPSIPWVKTVQGHGSGGVGGGAYLPEFIFDDCHLQAVILGQDVVHCKRWGGWEQTYF